LFGAVRPGGFIESAGAAAPVCRSEGGLPMLWDFRAWSRFLRTLRRQPAKRTKKPARRVRLEVEDLEQRRLMATATLTGGMTLASDGSGSGTYTVSVDWVPPNTQVDVTVDVNKSAGEGVSGSADEITYIFPAARLGYSGSTTVSLSGADDQTVTATIVSTVNASIGTPSSYTFVSPDPTLTVALSAAAYDVNQNGGSITIPLTGTLTGTGDQDPASVDFSTGNGSALAGTDYTATSGTVSFSPGSTSGSLTIPITNENNYDLGENFTVTLSNPVNCVLGSPTTATVTIHNVLPPPAVAFDSSATSVNENAGSVTLGVSLTGSDTDLTVTVHYATADGSAVTAPHDDVTNSINLGDYSDTSGTLTFAPGVRHQTFSVPIIDDLRNGPNDTFTATLSSPTVATLGSPATEGVTIVNTNPLPHLSFAAQRNNVVEGAGTALITLILDRASERTVKVHYKTQPCDCGAGNLFPGWDGELPGGVDPATPKEDYFDVEGDLSFSPGETGKAFSVPIIDDNVEESLEGLRLQLTNPDNAILTRTGWRPLQAPGNAAWAILVINDDDHTTLTFDGAGNVTEQDFSDGSKRQWTYDSGSGKEASYTNELNQASAFTYDSSGDLLTATDPLGRTTTLTYDSQGEVKTVKRPDAGGVMTYVYDGQERQTNLINADGTTQTFTYDAAGNLTTRTDERNFTTTFTYDSRHELLTQKDPLGGVTTYSYDSHGNLASVTDPLGHTATFTYDNAGHRLTSTDALGHTTTYAYDSQGGQTSVTDPLGHTTTDTRDSRERVLTEQDALGNVVTYTYDDVNHIQTMKDPLGHTTTMVYDVRGRLLRTIDALGNVTSSTYDVAGERLTNTDPLGHTSTFAYDQAGRQVSMTDALGHTATTVYDSLGRVQASIDALGHRTTYSYDNRDRQTAVTDALANVTTTVYDNASNAVATVDVRGNRTTFTYDGLNRQTEVQDALGNRTTTVYDAARNVLATVDARGDRTTFTYDADNRQMQVTDALNHLTTTVYDAAGNVLATIDARANRTSFAYDADNRQVSQTDALNHTATTVYDNAGNVLATIDVRGNRTTFAYDVVNRQIQTTDAAGGVATVVYDAAGDVLATVNQLGNRTSFSYDALNRQITTTDALGLVSSTTYDAAGNMLT
jgi:YD repeat-containing protein